MAWLFGVCFFAVSTHSRLKAAGYALFFDFFRVDVSTHSRLKAAGRPPSPVRLAFSGFNTQPPEGGWLVACVDRLVKAVFQHTAARRRLDV